MIVGFAGSGNMAAALARGLDAARRDGATEAQLRFTDSGSGRAAALAAELDGGECGSLEALAEASDVVVLAVKPAALSAVAPALQDADRIVSVLGATSLLQLRDAFPDAECIRTMPNVGSEVRRGVICVAAPSENSAAPDPELLGLLELIAEVFVVPEEQIDAATAVMGCAPAFIAHASGALIDAGVDAGLGRELAERLVAPTVEGTGVLLRRHGPAEIETAVASPGGSTEAGLEELRGNEVAAGFKAAVAGAIERMEGRR